MVGKKGEIILDRTPYRQQKTATLTHDDQERRGK
jgi:hypothetical protein